MLLEILVVHKKSMDSIGGWPPPPPSCYQIVLSAVWYTDLTTLLSAMIIPLSPPKNFVVVLGGQRTTSHPLVGEFGMTALHVLFGPNRDLLEVLLDK